MVGIVAKFEEKIVLDNNVSDNNLVTSTTFESKVVVLLFFICLNKTLTFRGVFEPKNDHFRISTLFQCKSI